MGNNEESKSSKTEKPSTPEAMDLANVHAYPDWAAMQAHYGPRVALPPYYGTAISSGPTPHPYMWGPAQPMMLPYGTPYTAVYPPGGIYGHPGVPFGTHPQGQGLPNSPPGSAPGSMEASSAKLPGNADRSLMKKLKSFDGLAMSIGNGIADSAEQKKSQSSETEGSSEGTNARGDQGRNKRSPKGTTSVDRKPETNPADGKNMGTAVVHSSGTSKSVGPVSPALTSALELKNRSSVNLKMAPSEAWLQDERQLKRERRKQSNRESARRSRLRKQAETEELAKKVECLFAENVALKSEISKLTEDSEELRLENATLVEKLEKVQSAKSGERILSKLDGSSSSDISTGKPPSRVNNKPGSTERSKEGEDESYKRNSNTGAKLHQLLDPKPRTDAVAAG